MISGQPMLTFVATLKLGVAQHWPARDLRSRGPAPNAHSVSRAWRFLVTGE
jgi:hypothetical protein